MRKPITTPVLSLLGGALAQPGPVVPDDMQRARMTNPLTKKIARGRDKAKAAKKARRRNRR